MTNKDRQHSLDKKKYIASEQAQCDMSGKMVYCEFCPMCNNENCSIDHETRVDKCVCAKAFNKMKRK